MYTEPRYKPAVMKMPYFHRGDKYEAISFPVFNINGIPAVVHAASCDIKTMNGRLIYSYPVTVLNSVITLPEIAPADTAKFPLEQLKLQIQVDADVIGKKTIVVSTLTPEGWL